ncbi:hypothetical protein B296_00028349 [Ensete ventricosum]|uniref:Uncharacterized protein n=1 Tax=Ensete ventricosum TaxID=4639 RepID=A0A426YQT0_ENSVE|nr:hypothetical protein B296_00028349 [Ensete ventricosum]
MPPANEAERWKWENAAAGAVAGFATVAALHPLDVVRTRFQEASVTLPRPHSLFLVTSDEEKPVAKKSLPREVLLIHNAVMRFFGRKPVLPSTSGTYRSDRIPVRGPPATGRYHRIRSLPTQKRGDASSPRAGRGDASFPAQEQGDASSPRAGRGDASFLAQEQGDASSPRMGE